MNTITGLTLSQLVHGLRSGSFSSREAVQAYLEQIERLEPTLHAFLTLASEQALAQADRADSQLTTWRKSKEDKIPPLLGVPIAIKDVLCVAGLRCTAGSRILENFVPPYSATAVERLLEAGVIVLGKTNTDEFAMGSSTENSGYGPTRNPWNTERVPGGSSGGSAAVVAADMAPAALGSDTGGSIRQPAAFCGVSGIKPTYGRVSRYGLIAYGSSLDCVGAFARQVSDVALIYSLIAGGDKRDATSMDYPQPQVNLDDYDLNGLRIGIPDEYFIGGIQPEVEACVQEAIRVLQTLGSTVKHISLPHTEYALPVYYLIAPAEASANLARFDGIRYGPREDAENMWDIFRHTRGERFGAEVKRRIMLGTYALSAGYYDAYYGRAQKVRTLIKKDFEQAFVDVDVIAAPVAPTTAFPLGYHSDNPLAMYLEDIFTLPANLAGIPGLVFPVGFDKDGLPIGMQLMGSHFDEDSLFKAGHAYQQVTNWHQRKPPMIEKAFT
ncbi:MAG: Asp-tRNA(Asn)/Glu-tRNA(Gln) amidotransferase subunit GatA [Anaerolineaceae bacterium]